MTLTIPIAVHPNSIAFYPHRSSLVFIPQPESQSHRRWAGLGSDWRPALQCVASRPGHFWLALTPSHIFLFSYCVADAGFIYPFFVLIHCQGWRGCRWRGCSSGAWSCSGTSGGWSGSRMRRRARRRSGSGCTRSSCRTCRTRSGPRSTGSSVRAGCLSPFPSQSI
jgi:hypothetical protein